MLDWSASDTPKTSAAYAALKKAGLHDRKVTVFLPFGSIASYMSLANIPTVRILFFDQPELATLMQSDYWIVLKDDYERFKKMVEQWI